MRDGERHRSPLVIQLSPALGPAAAACSLQWLRDLVERCIDADPTRRFVDAKSVHKAMSTILRAM